MSSLRSGLLGLFLSLTLGAIQVTPAQTVVNSIFMPQGGAGNYGDPNNWSPPEVPNNSSATSYDVTVPSLTSQITMNIDATVSSFTLNSATFLSEGHSLIVNDFFTNDGGLRMTSAYDQPSLLVVLGALTNFDAGSRTLTGGGYSLGGNYIVGSNHPTVLQFSGADIVHNAAFIGLAHPLAKIVDENGSDALRNFTDNTAGGVFSVASRNFSVPGNFTNDGLITIWDGTLSVNGSLNNFDPSTRTLTGGSYTLYWPGNVPSRFAFDDADIFDNAASIYLFGGARISDENGNDALRNFAHNLRGGEFTINDSYVFAAASDFTNAGVVNIFGDGDISRAHFIIPAGHRYLQTEGTTSLWDGMFTGEMEINGGSFTTRGNPAFGNPADLNGDLNIGDAFLDPRSLTVHGAVHLSQNSQLLVIPQHSIDGIFAVTGTLTAGGTLLIETPKSPPPSSETYLVIQADGGVIGRFSNAPNGGRVPTNDGLGSFAVSYTPNTISISNFQIIPATTRLLNISTRVEVETGENVLVGGFIINGTQPKRIIVRGLGPSLSGLFPGVLADPVLELHDSTGRLIASNDNWPSDQEAEIIATGIPPSNNLESAIVTTLPANNSAYTAVVRGMNNGTGIGVVEAYDLDQTVDSKSANISTRGFVQTGDNVLIAGLIMFGPDPLTVIIRAIGPSLPGPGALQDPMLSLYDGNGGLVGANDNWRSDQEAQIIATGIPPSNDLESAIVARLPAIGGSYTAIVQGKNGATGVALVEVYDLNR